ncbi:MAG: Glycerate dehydrogenase [Candidatus Accumulibacter regalis]|jgi:glycerate dehydrogenase|uniref:Glycerate dehydrogenase n=1 Tax=Accumulibacter regalis TaxID=522306 RepID=A0A011NWC9_ACCRE|nr:MULTISPECIES: D-2-hydroxyacid dehydrogenase [unclassified Candidatus Accumulibacter]EXI86983.1 MAG: Glycerate dehydrogenase [Candidatus Accumulibacter regalis]MBL8366411.1 D-2-hydroxyacid dehydrogenase [Accumulibacter sp.]MBN8514747.1 D-2-hydroxyacid dehydrogenase [Accumulibacter sp.]MBO3703731.1 D-2-hydroxyacid dehydrogenase [Accumulibacter sp.]HRE70443.1 D-2-hydroxyacid dehydrogenase [Accumulibacter sp.]
MHRIVFLERESIIAEVRRPDFPHHWVEHAQTLQHEVKERLAGATMAIVNKLQIDAELIAALPALQMVAVAATGSNNIDVDACRERGIVVSNVRGYAVHSVPEQVLAMLLALSRNLFAYRQAVVDGRWQRSGQFCFFDYPIRDLHGATLALIGSGSLGSGVARLAAAFGMRVLRSERKDALSVRPGYTPFAEALRQADVVSLHCPLNAETARLIGEAELRSMKTSALLINTARGGLVDEAALARALHEGWIAGAGFDVLSVEPPRSGNALLAPELLALPNFLLTPHVAWASQPAMQALADQLIDNLEAFARGEPQHVLT